MVNMVEAFCSRILPSNDLLSNACMQSRDFSILFVLGFWLMIPMVEHPSDLVDHDHITWSQSQLTDSSSIETKWGPKPMCRLSPSSNEAHIAQVNPFSDRRRDRVCQRLLHDVEAC